MQRLKPPSRRQLLLKQPRLRLLKQHLQEQIWRRVQQVSPLLLPQHRLLQLLLDPALLLQPQHKRRQQLLNLLSQRQEHQDRLGLVPQDRRDPEQRRLVLQHPDLPPHGQLPP